MKRLLYISNARGDVDAAMIQSILQTSRRNNARNGLTGLLLFIDGAFLQILEGEAAAVDRTFDIIRLDRRHSGVKILVKDDIEQRRFPNWTMGYFHLKEAAEPALFDLTRAALADRLPSPGADELASFVETFYRLHTRDSSIQAAGV